MRCGLKAAITKIGAEVYGRALCRLYGVRLAGKALFLAADGEAGAHGGGFLAGLPWDMPDAGEGVKSEVVGSIYSLLVLACWDDAGHIAK